MVTVEQLGTMFGVITDCIKRPVVAYADEATGRRILGAISGEFDLLANRMGEA
jgi:hypothetical protein